MLPGPVRPAAPPTATVDRLHDISTLLTFLCPAGPFQGNMARRLVARCMQYCYDHEFTVVPILPGRQNWHLKACISVPLRPCFKKVELRRARRYGLQLPCRVLDRSRDFVYLSGVTVNMSNCGLLVSRDDAEAPYSMPEVGQSVRVVVELPRAPCFQGRYLGGSGHVVRISQEAGSCLVALDLRRCAFQESL